MWVGRIAEVFKKYVRDGEFNHVKFEEAMLGLLYAWMSVCRTAGLDWQHVVRVNQEKIEGRVARNTMRGSGNDR